MFLQHLYILSKYVPVYLFLPQPRMVMTHHQGESLHYPLAQVSKTQRHQPQVQFPVVHQPADEHPQVGADETYPQSQQGLLMYLAQ